MALIPWRVKNFVSEHFPLLYHLAVNAVKSRKSADYWDARLEETWDAAERHWPAKNKLIASLTTPADVVLDIGCGNGGILRELKRRGYRHLHGMEISKYAVHRLKEEGIEMHVGIAPSVPLPDCKVDVVIASQVLEHVIQRRKFLKEIRRVLKPAGRAFIFVPDNCLGPIDEHEHVAKYNAESLRILLASCFSIITIESMRDENCPLPILFAHVAKPVP